MIIPYELAIETVSACNARCPYCARTYLGHSAGVMSLDVYKKILVDAYASGVRSLRLWVWGEPTLNKNLVLFAALAHKVGFTVALSSNGQLFDKYLEVLRYVHEVRFSVDGWDQQSYARHRVGLDFFTVMQCIRKAHAFKTEHALPVVLSIGTVSAKNIDVGTFLDTWFSDGKTCDRVQFLGMSPYTIFNAKNKQFEMKFNEAWRDQYFLGERLPDSAFSALFRCDYLYRVMVVGVNGDMCLCCNDMHAEVCNTNVLTCGIVNAYNSSVIQSVRDMHSRGDYTMCNGCTMFFDNAKEWNAFQRKIAEEATIRGIQDSVS